MNTALWIIQGILAAAFFMAGAMKLVKPIDELSKSIGDWVYSLSATAVRGIGFVEIAGAIGLILPMLLDIYPILTPIAATGLALTMIGALSVHLKRKENKESVVNLILMVLSIFVAVGRFDILSV